VVKNAGENFNTETGRSHKAQRNEIRRLP